MEHAGIAVTEKSHTLLDVLRSIQSVVQRTYAGKSYWVRCELARISLHTQSGHCYLELVEKSEQTILAQLKGIIWSDKYDFVIGKFKAVTNTPLSAGMKVLFLCSVNFHPVHGLSFTITDIEPSFTLGEMARMKNESVARLKSEGLFTRNKNLKLPLLPGRIALISVETSRGYQDFVSTLHNHSRKYAIHLTLFEAVLQGENAVPSLIRAINNIEGDKESFDAIAIIRGGAGDAGLTCYDEYALASVVARCSLPVISGIGHATNETVVEMIVFKNCITPTAAATFILDQFDIQNQLISDAVIAIQQSTRELLNFQRQDLVNNSSRFCLLVQNRIERAVHSLKSIHAAMPSNIGGFVLRMKQDLLLSVNTILNVKKFVNHVLLFNELKRTTVNLQQTFLNRLTSFSDALKTSTSQLQQSSAILENKKENLKHLEEKVNLLDPVNTLRRGYSITRYQGKAITQVELLNPGNEIETTLANGKIISTVKSDNKNGKEKNL